MQNQAQTSLEYLLLIVVVAALIAGLVIFVVPMSVNTAGTMEGGMGEIGGGGTTIGTTYTCTVNPGCFASTNQPDHTVDNGDTCSGGMVCYECDTVGGYSWDGSACV